MNTFQRIHYLANNKGMSIAQLERKLKLSNGSIARWKKSAPSSRGLTIIADYFDVSVDYLLGREKEKYSGEENSDNVIMFSDKEEFDKLPKKEKERILNSLKDQADYLIYKYKTKKGDK